MRQIAVITGTRAEYGILAPVLEKIELSQKLNLQLIVTGMHLAPEYGYTARDIEKDGFPIAAYCEMLLAGNSRASMGKSLGLGIQTLTHEIERLRPDVVMVLGDRIEAFAGATGGLFCGGTVAHIHGGEVTQGGLDEYMRHAITKLSHIHFPATAKSRDRILQMGENPDFTYCVGTPGLDALLAFPNLTNQEISKELGITLPDRFALLVQHPVSTQAETAGQDFLATLTALEESSIPTILIYPNADAGSQAMIQLIKEWQHKDWLYPFVNVTRKIFCNLLKRAIVLIGNSSSGMIDAPAYGVPVINIGTRQQGRERGENVLDVPPQKARIKKALQKVMTDEEFIQQAQNTENPYGDGHAADRIVKTLENVDLKKAQSAKMFRE